MPRGGIVQRLGLLLEGLVVVFVFGALVDLCARLFGLGESILVGRFLGFAALATILVLLFAALGLRARSENFADLGLSRERFAPALALLLGLLAGLVVAALGFGLELAFANFGFAAPNLPFGVTGLWSFVGFSLGALLLGGLAEELIFRGYAFRRLEKGLGSQRSSKGKLDSGTLWAVLLLSTLFGLSHAYQGWTGQVQTGLMSLAFFGVYFAVKRDLGVVIVAHATVDAIGFWFLWQAV